jgi:hypothetical protein
MTSIATARTGAPSEPASLMGKRLKKGFGKSKAARLARFSAITPPEPRMAWWTEPTTMTS